MNIILAILGIFSLCVVLGGVYRIRRSLFNVRRTAHWAMTKGQIIMSEARIRPGRYRAYDSTGKYLFCGPTGGVTRYIAKIAYNYDVAGIRYYGDKFNSSGEFTSTIESEVKQVQRAYPNNSTVTVYYNPNNPTESVLNRRITQQELRSELVGGGVVAIFGLVCLALLMIDSLGLTFLFFGIIALIWRVHRWLQSITPERIAEIVAKSRSHTR